MHPDFRQFSDEQVDAAVRRALSQVDLPESYRISIRALVRSRAMNWRTCCGGSCNPCIGRIEEAVDLARRHLLEAPDPVHESKPAQSTGDPAAPLGESPSSPADSDASEEEDDAERNWGRDYH